MTAGTFRARADAGAENDYARKMRSVAQEVRKILLGPQALEFDGMMQILMKLDDYARAVTPWAEKTAMRMVEAVDRANKDQWAKNSEAISAALRREITEKSDVSKVYKDLSKNQVALIKSIPEKAAVKFREIIANAVVSGGTRGETLKKAIMALGDMTEARAVLIARTESSRAMFMLTEARARYIGSTGYIWRTSHDSDVRESHRKMEGRLVSWDDPPTLDGMTGHAGCLPNCRCEPEVVLPDLPEGAEKADEWPRKKTRRSRLKPVGFVRTRRAKTVEKPKQNRKAKKK